MWKYAETHHQQYIVFSDLGSHLGVCFLSPFLLQRIFVERPGFRNLCGAPLGQTLASLEGATGQFFNFLNEPRSHLALNVKSFLAIFRYAVNKIAPNYTFKRKHARIQIVYTYLVQTGHLKKRV